MSVRRRCSGGSCLLYTSPDELRSFLYDVAGYVLREHVVLHGGETVGFSTGQKLALTLSPGVSVEGESLKVAF